MLRLLLLATLIISLNIWRESMPSAKLIKALEREGFFLEFPGYSSKEGLIAEILKEDNSPAVGVAQEIYDAGVKYKIDPAIALAFFAQESQYGTASKWAGRANYQCGPEGSLNFGNIAVLDEDTLGHFCENFGGQQCSGNRFCKYPSWGEGVRAWYVLLAEGKRYISVGKDTVEKIIPVYCPATECDVSGYIANVRSFVSEYRDRESNKPKNT